MEEDRDFIRLLIEQSKEDVIKLFDDTLKEFDHLDGLHVSKRKYHSRYAIQRYNNHLGVVFCKVSRSMKFILSMIRGFKLTLNYREDKVRKLKQIYHSARERANKRNCRRAVESEPIL